MKSNLVYRLFCFLWGRLTGYSVPTEAGHFAANSQLDHRAMEKSALYYRVSGFAPCEARYHLDGNNV